MTVRLTICGGTLTGIIMQMGHSKFLIGREKDCLLRPSSPTVSRHHCVLLQDDSGLRVQDLDSTNGTYVNGRRIHGEVTLQQGDMISVGEVTIQVDLSQASMGSPKQVSAVETIMHGDETTAEFQAPDVLRETGIVLAPTSEDAPRR